MAITREGFLAKCHRRYAMVDLPDGEQVEIQSLTALEKSDYEVWIMNQKTGRTDLKKYRLAEQRLCILTCVTPDRSMMFQPGDESELGNVDAAFVKAIFQAAQKHCGFLDGDIEGLVKNSEETGEKSSPTD